ITAGLVSFIHFREKPPRGELIRFQIPAPENIRFPAYPFLSPDGRMIAFSGRGAGGRNVLWVRSLDALEARALLGTEGAGDRAIWSPDSRFIGFVAEGKLKKVPVSGGAPQTLCDISGLIASGAWSRSGVIIFGSLGHGLMRVPESGGASSPLTALDPSRESSHTDPAFLPDGRHFIYYRASASVEHSGLYLGSLDARPEQQSSHPLLATASGAGYAPSVDPTEGYLLFLRQGSLM